MNLNTLNSSLKLRCGIPLYCSWVSKTAYKYKVYDFFCAT